MKKTPKVGWFIIAAMLALTVHFPLVRLTMISTTNKATIMKVKEEKAKAAMAELHLYGGRKTRSCPSLYLMGGANEHSPLIFSRDNLLVCRTPKVGSSLLRTISYAYEYRLDNETAYAHINNLFPDRMCNSLSCNNTLEQVTDAAQFSNYIYGADTRRLLFVRHPVLRILSGFLQVSGVDDFWTKEYGFNHSYGTSPQAFELWVTNSSFVNEYDPSCGNNSLTYSRHGYHQHWNPPQHCRCGIHDCEVKWTFVRIEDESVVNVMARYLLQPWLKNVTAKVGSRPYNEKEYLSLKVLSVLNPLTQKEQEFFGYQPYTLSGL